MFIKNGENKKKQINIIHNPPFLNVAQMNYSSPIIVNALVLP